MHFRVSYNSHSKQQLFIYSTFIISGRDLIQAIRLPFVPEPGRVRAEANPYKNFVGQNGSETGFPPSISFVHH